MPTTVTMPQLGETVTEGTILRWAKQVGDSIVEDEVLVEISTDKVDTEVPSPAAGKVLEILVAEGDTVGVGTALAVIGDAGEQPAPAAEPESAPAEETAPQEPAAEPPEPEPAPEPEKASDAAPAATKQTEQTEQETPQEVEKAKDGEPTAEEVDAFFSEPDVTERQPNLLSPVVRKLIREHEIDVSKVSGTGQGGRITRKDVETYLEGAVISPPSERSERWGEYRRRRGGGHASSRGDRTNTLRGSSAGAHRGSR